MMLRFTKSRSHRQRDQRKSWHPRPWPVSEVIGLAINRLIWLWLILNRLGPPSLQHTDYEPSILHLRCLVRRNISIGIPLDLSIPTEMTSIESLVENENSSKTLKKLKIMLCYIFSD